MSLKARSEQLWVPVHTLNKPVLSVSYTLPAKIKVCLVILLLTVYLDTWRWNRERTERERKR